MAYVSVEELRNECVSEEDADDARLSTLIEMASREFDRWTGRFFEPRPMRFKLNGKGNGTILLGDPIISIDSVSVWGEPFEIDDPDDPPFVVFNRHLGGMTSPDDRVNPRIQLVQERGSRTPTIHLLNGMYVWPVGQQNIEIVGTFGYTDPDGTPTGRTPLLVKRAVMLLVAERLTPVGDTDARAEARFASRVIEERTRDQAYKLDKIGTDPRSTGRFTGIPEVDQIIAFFRKGAAVGVV